MVLGSTGDHLIYILWYISAYNTTKHFRNYFGTRWFDKSFSLIISRDGTAAVNFEHSWGDGVAVLRFFQDIYKDTNDNLFVHSNTGTSSTDVSNSVRELGKCNYFNE